jgi:hypothetical protein
MAEALRMQASPTTAASRASRSPMKNFRPAFESIILNPKTPCEIPGKLAGAIDSLMSAARERGAERKVEGILRLYATSIKNDIVLLTLRRLQEVVEKTPPGRLDERLGACAQLMQEFPEAADTVPKLALRLDEMTGGARLSTDTMRTMMKRGFVKSRTLCPDEVSTTVKAELDSGAFDSIREVAEARVRMQDGAGQWAAKDLIHAAALASPGQMIEAARAQTSGRAEAQQAPAERSEGARDNISPAQEPQAPADMRLRLIQPDLRLSQISREDEKRPHGSDEGRLVPERVGRSHSLRRQEENFQRRKRKMVRENSGPRQDAVPSVRPGPSGKAREKTPGTDPPAPLTPDQAGARPAPSGKKEERAPSVKEEEAPRRADGAPAPKKYDVPKADAPRRGAARRKGKKARPEAEAPRKKRKAVKAALKPAKRAAKSRRRPGNRRRKGGRRKELRAFKPKSEGIARRAGRKRRKPGTGPKAKALKRPKRRKGGTSLRRAGAARAAKETLRSPRARKARKSGRKAAAAIVSGRRKVKRATARTRKDACSLVLRAKPKKQKKGAKAETGGPRARTARKAARKEKNKRKAQILFKLVA